MTPKRKGRNKVGIGGGRKERKLQTNISPEDKRKTTFFGGWVGVVLQFWGLNQELSTC